MEYNLNSLLQKISVRLAAYLEKVLPSLFEDWWKQAVVDNLSFQQRQRMEQRNINSLGGLDLATLLRVLDQNWYQVSNKLNLPSETRHFVKEMQTIRNRWAHTSTESISSEDTYRDLDTLQRFAVTIQADDDLIQEIRETKKSLLVGEMQPLSQNTAVDAPSPKNAEKATLNLSRDKLSS